MLIWTLNRYVLEQPEYHMLFYGYYIPTLGYLIVLVSSSTSTALADEDRNSLAPG
jgi:hypothetical protein